MRKFVLLLSSLALVPIAITAQQPDRHFVTPSIAAIAHESTFLHGYLHGYEEGFHQGDFDLQMGRIENGDNRRSDAPKGYEKQFGPKQMFFAGYKEGFSVGYADAADERRFRAFDNVLRAAASEATEPSSAAMFDEGVRQGYLAGQHQGLNDARRDAQAQPSVACPTTPTNQGQEFCSAFTSGYQLGYADGFANQAKTTTMAEK